MAVLINLHDRVYANLKCLQVYMYMMILTVKIMKMRSGYQTFKNSNPRLPYLGAVAPGLVPGSDG